MLIRQINRDKIKAVFVENMSNSKLLAQITRDTGVTLGPKLYVDALSGPNEPGSSYLLMMRHNVTQLVAGMRLNSTAGVSLLDNYDFYSSLRLNHKHYRPIWVQFFLFRYVSMRTLVLNNTLSKTTFYGLDDTS